MCSLCTLVDCQTTGYHALSSSPQSPLSRLSKRLIRCVILPHIVPVRNTMSSAHILISTNNTMMALDSRVRVRATTSIAILSDIHRQSRMGLCDSVIRCWDFVEGPGSVNAGLDWPRLRISDHKNGSMVGYPTIDHHKRRAHQWDHRCRCVRACCSTRPSRAVIPTLREQDGLEEGLCADGCDHDHAPHMPQL